MADIAETIFVQDPVAGSSLTDSVKRAKVHLLADDENETPIKTVRVTVQQILDKADNLMYRSETKTGHGLVVGDVGKPLSGFAVLVDTSATSWPSGILTERTDVNTIKVAPPGADVTLPIAMLQGGSSYDLAASGRYIYWDFSLLLYVSKRPVDSLVPCILELITVGSTTFSARVRSF